MTVQKKKILFYSDCPFFAGCENMLVNFLSSDALRETYMVSFAFRDTAAYREGLERRVPHLQGIDLLPVSIAEPSDWWANMTAKNRSRFWIVALSSLFLCLCGYLWIDLFNAMRLYATVFRQRHFDVIHINNGGYPGARSTMVAAFVARLTGQGPAVFVVNNIAVPRTFKNWLSHGWWTYGMGYLVAACVTASAAANRAWKDVLRTDVPRWLALPNGIRKRHADRSREAIRSTFGISADTLVFGMVAILESRKGHKVAIDAIAKMQQSAEIQSKKFVLLIEGTGPDEEMLKTYVSSLELDSIVRFVGHQTNIVDFYLSLDVLLVPSLRNEDFPNVILEAMSLGLPVIGTRVAGIPEQIVDGHTGYVVAPNDSMGLAERMGLFVEDVSVGRSMGQAAAVRFEQHYKAERAVERYLGLYAELLNTKTRIY